MGSKDSKVIRIPMFSGLKYAVWPRDFRILMSHMFQDLKDSKGHKDSDPLLDL